MERTGKEKDSLEVRVGTLEVRVEEGFKRVDENFKRVDEKFKRVDEKFKEVKDDIAKLDVKVDERSHTLDAKLDAAVGGLRVDLKSDIARLDGKIEKLDGKIDTVAAALDARFTGLYKALIGGGFAIFVAVVGPAVARSLGA